jgi:hypothetical protein
MRALPYLAAIILLSAFTSCGGNNKEDVVDKDLLKAAEENKAAQKTDTVPSTATQVTAPVMNNAVPVTSQPLTTQPVTIGTNTLPVTKSGTVAPVTINTQPVTQQTVQQPTAAGMNPAHGQPGHRCDIPVGSPLNSKPQAPNPTATVSTAPAAPQPVAQQATAAGMNPPHGQPGHRCDIPVGSPLNSKPAQATVTPVTTTPKADSSKNK